MKNAADTTAVQEKRYFRRVKAGIILMLVIFAIQAFTPLPELWPLTRWRMYSRTHDLPPTLTILSLDVTDAAGRVHRLFPRQLGVAGERLIAGVFEGANQDAYLPALLERAQMALPEIEIRSIEGQRLHYSLYYHDLPPLRLAQPDNLESLGRIAVSAEGDAS